ncbi:response regulator [Hellea sp.]|nr:response regulator [Hellea sp.]
MKKLKNISKSFRAIALIALLGAATPLSAIAQTNIISEKNTKLAEEIGVTIRDEGLQAGNFTSLDQAELTDLSPVDQLRLLRHYAQGTIALSYNLDPEDIISTYESAVKASGTPRDKAVFELHKKFLQNFDLSKPKKNNLKLIELLEKETSNKDWFVANTAWLLLSIVNSYANNPSLALQETEEAYKLIPNEISDYVTEARILTLTRTAYLNNLSLNPNLAIENTLELIKQKREAGYPIDGSSLLNNLLYSLSQWRETEVSTNLASVMMELEEETTSNVAGLTELRIAQLLDRKSEFKSALIHIYNGLKIVEVPALRESFLFLEINSLIGIGSVTEAKEKLAKIEADNFNTESIEYRLKLTRAKLGLAIASDNKPAIYELSNKLQDLTIQNLLHRYSTNTSQLIASLENTKERQAEREAGLTREANLQKAKAEQRRQVNQLLLILIALLSFAAFLALVFARYRDRTSKQLAVKTLEAEDADRMKSEFLGMVSHELRTPLNGIVGIADLLSTQAPTDDLRHKAGIILDSSNRLTQVIESIVDMSAIDGDKVELYPEPTNVQDIVQELDKVWRPVIEDKGVIFTSHVDSKLSDDVIIDKMRLRKCLNNLLSNAAKFTESGRVHLHITTETIDETGETEITAIVADTGQGMSEEVQGKLFTPFLQADSTMTRKHGGSGLGLAITQSLARMMGGDVTMMSAQGRGSEFTMTVRAIPSEAAQILDNVEALLNSIDMTPASDLDMAQPKKSQSPDESMVFSDEISNIIPPAEEILVLETEAPASDDLRNLKVLIVEDEVFSQEVIKNFLEPEGCKLLFTGNGVEALDVLNTQAVDVILMDLRMPEMDGIETTRAIRRSSREYKDTPIVALTADSAAETNAACMAAGVDIFLTKPILAHELVEAVRFTQLCKETSQDLDAKVA